MNLKEKYRAFVEWQRQTPISYELKSTETHLCNNCGHDFTGNYCPYCSQKAGAGRLTWASVREGVMDIWAMGGRSMPYSIFQLFARPGYFIADYISGKRMVSFPPVKMLFVLAVIVGMIEFVFFPSETPKIDEDSLKDIGGLGELIQEIAQWLKTNKGWAMLLRGVLFILPTWVIFRHAPRLPFHTLPEGFFIQVFVGIEVLIFSFFDHFGSLSSYLSVFYIVYTYWQLFGYGVWGTLWRLGVLGVYAFLFLLLAVLSYMFLFDPTVLDNIKLQAGESKKQGMAVIGVVLLAFTALTALILLIGYAIDRHGMRRRQREEEHRAQQQQQTSETIQAVSG